MQKEGVCVRSLLLCVPASVDAALIDFGISTITVDRMTDSVTDGHARTYART